MADPLRFLEENILRLAELMHRAVDATEGAPPLEVSEAEAKRVDGKMRELEAFRQAEAQRLHPVAAAVVQQLGALHELLGQLCDTPVERLNEEIVALELRNREVAASVVAAYDEAASLESSLVRFLS